MSSVARVNDSTSGKCGITDEEITGTCSSGSSNVTINGEKAHREGDSGECNCSLREKFETTEGSSSVTVNGKKLSRVDDMTTCKNEDCKKKNPISTGSSNVTCG